VASLIGANEKEIIFTSGATESNNLALKGVARFYRSERKNHIVTLKTEHKCLLDSARVLEEEGFRVTYLPVGEDGILDLQAFEDALQESTIMASVMAVNNEIGVRQDLQAIGAICRKHKVIFHSDCAQAFGKLPLDVGAMNLDLMSISGHKVYGPKGVGALYIRRKPKIRLHPLLNGGGQERGLRSGTVAPALVVGLGQAARVARETMAFDEAHISRLEKKLLDELASWEQVKINGHPTRKVHGCLNFSIAGVEGESLMMAIKNYAVSSGSACTSTSLEPSYVLQALNIEPEMAHTSIRVGISRFTTEREVS
jgi:cysteine desulfurase